MNERVVLFSASLPGWAAEEVIEAARILGFTGIEWGVGVDQAISDPARGAEIRAQCDSAGLGCGGVAVQDRGVTLATPPAALAWVELAAELGAPHMRVRAPRYQGQSLGRQQAASREGLAAVVHAAAPRGLAVLVETSPDTLAPTPDAAVGLIVRHSPGEVGVLYDPGNMIIEGHVDPRLAVACLDEYLLHVHVKNVGWRRREGSWQWHYSRLSGGLADWPATLSALAAAGYAGRFSLDHLPGGPTRSLLRAEAEALSVLVDETFSGSAADGPDGRGGGKRAGTVSL